MKKLTRQLSILLILVLLLTGCGGSGQEKEGENGKDPQTGQTGDSELVLIKNADIMSLDSCKATDEMSFEVLGSIMEGLYVLDENGMESEALVDSVEESEDGLTYTFKLKDAKWSNGTPVTADDFVFAWRKLGDPDTGSEYAFMLDTAGIKNGAEILSGEVTDMSELGVKALDEKTLEVQLVRRVPFFKKLLSFGSFLPQNEEFVKSQGEQYAKTPENLIYNGPFKMTEWISGNSFKAVKNEEYWDKDNVKIDAITWKLAMDSQTAALEFDTGAADYVRLSGEVVDRYQGDERLDSDLGGYLWFLVQNLEKVPELNNTNLTLAIANSIDRDELAEIVLKDGAIGAKGFVPKKLATSPDGKDFREQNGDFFTEGPEKAQEYAKKAFEELGIDSLELELLFEDTEESKKVAEYLQAQIQKNVPGLTINLKSQPKKARVNLQLDGEFELALHRWGPDYPDPMTYLQLFLSDSSYNYNRYKNERYDELVDQAVNGGLSDEDRWQVMLEAEQELLKDAQGPIPVYQTGNATLWNPKVDGVVYSTTGVSYYYKHAVKE